MILDTSAIIAILFKEIEAEKYFSIIEQNQIVCVVTPTLLETVMVAKSIKGISAVTGVEELLMLLEIRILDFSSAHLVAAKSAFLRYGKGQGHPAQLNFGDCMSYAASKVEMMPLLFKGSDFKLTDVECAF